MALAAASRVARQDHQLDHEACSCGQAGIWGDDLLGYGKPHHHKKWWVDLEWVDGVLRAPRKKGKDDDGEFERGELP